MEHEKVEAACPKCRSRLLRRSRHDGFVSWVRWRMQSRLPYRCMDCDNRFFIMVQTTVQNEPAPADKVTG